ncbi:hypothetical protein D3C83_234210 [compost metagenome]
MFLGAALLGKRDLDLILGRYSLVDQDFAQPHVFLVRAGHVQGVAVADSDWIRARMAEGSKLAE